MSPGDGGAGPRDEKIRENAANGLRQFMCSSPPFASLPNPVDASSSWIARRTSMTTRTHSACPPTAAACSAVPPGIAPIDRDLSIATGSAPCASNAPMTACRPARAAAMSGVAPSENSTFAPAPHRRRDDATAPAPPSSALPCAGEKRAAGERCDVGDRSVGAPSDGSGRCLVAISSGVRPDASLASGEIPAAVHRSMTKAAHSGLGDAAAARRAVASRS